MTPFTFDASQKVIEKLRDRHGVTLEEVEECFYNRTAGFLEDKRAEHKTDPPTQWFVSETDKGKILKVIFMMADKVITIKSAYEADDIAQRIYKNEAK